MRENRPYGSEGGAADQSAVPTPIEQETGSRRTRSVGARRGKIVPIAPVGGE